MHSDCSPIEPGPKRRIRGGWLVLFVPLLLVGYVLSAAPAGVLIETQSGVEGSLAGDMFYVVYAPLIWVMSSSPTFAMWHEAYWDWWLDLLGP